MPPRKPSAKSAATTLIKMVDNGDYRTAADAVADHPELRGGLELINKAAQAKKPTGSGPALLER